MELVVYDLESEKGLPFPNESFDIIFNKSLLEHLHKPDSFLKEAHRILRPNGKIICLVLIGNRTTKPILMILLIVPLLQSRL